MSFWHSPPTDDHTNLLSLVWLLLITCSCLLVFFYRSRNMALWKHLEAAKSHVLVLHGILVMLMMVFLINTVVSPYKVLMPLSALTRRVEDWANGESFLTMSQESLNHYAWYNAVVCSVVLVGLLIAYYRILTTSYICMESIGDILIQQSKEKDMEQSPVRLVTFELEIEQPEVAKPRTRMRKVHQVGLVTALFALTVLLLPTMAMNTFAYIIVDGDTFRLTSDHVLVTFALFFVVKVCRGLYYNFVNIPVGFSRVKFSVCQFSIVYGAILVIAATFFLSLTNDVMVTYTYKAYALYLERGTRPGAVAHDIVIENANYFTSSFANYLVDSTYAIIDVNMTKEETFNLLRKLIGSYKDMYIDLLQVMLFGCMVFVPGVMGSLVLFTLDI